MRPGPGATAIPGGVGSDGRRGLRLAVGRGVDRAFRIGIGGLEGVGDDRQMALEQAFDGLANVLQEVPSIGDLLGLGRASVAAWE